MRCSFVLLLACGASPAPASFSASPDEAEPSADATNDPLRDFLEAADEALYLLEVLDERDHYANIQEMREAYGDGEDCEGLCGLSIPLAPEPDAPEPEEPLYLADNLDAMAVATRAWTGEHWVTFAGQLRDAATAARAEGDPGERTNAAMTVVMRAIRSLTQSGVVDDAICLLGMRVVASDVVGMAAAMRDRANEESLRLQIDAGMDDSGAEVSADELEALESTLDHATPVMQRARTLLGEGRSKLDEAMRELDSLYSIMQGALRTRELESVRAQRDALAVTCGD